MAAENEQGDIVRMAARSGMAMHRKKAESRSRCEIAWALALGLLLAACGDSGGSLPDLTVGDCVTVNPEVGSLFVEGGMDVIDCNDAQFGTDHVVVAKGPEETIRASGDCEANDTVIADDATAVCLSIRIGLGR